MRRTRVRRVIVVGLAVSSALAILASAALASTTSVAYSFKGDENGEYPSTDLVIDRAGNIFGTTVVGGDFGSGTVFEVSPSGSGFTQKVLYSFTGQADGGQPYGGVTLDAAGNLYGTAVVGGSRTSGPCVEDGCGVVYELSDAGGTWTQQVLHTFAGGDDGYGPGSGLTFDRHGNLFGMTPTGGANGLGVVFELRPSTTGGWSFQTIHAFTGGRDGSSASAGRLLAGPAGDLFGVATTGGAHGSGTAFRLHPMSGGDWRFGVLYAFRGSPDAGFPYGALATDGAGNLYGTSYYDGAYDFGAVYELSPARNASWTEKVLYSFKGGSDGSGPISNVVFDPAGNLYGTTSEGGGVHGSGAIFELSPGSGGAFTETIVHRFAGPPDAAFPYNGMASDHDGHFFGTTVHGGTDDEGAVYEFTP